MLEAGSKSGTESAITQSFKTIQKADQFTGFLRAYTALADEGEVLPGEAKKVITTVLEQIAEFVRASTEIYDITLTKVTANMSAAADIKIGDDVLLADVPVEYLLFLEKRLAELQTFLAKVPTLDPALTWLLDTNTGLYESIPVITNRNQKVMRNHVVVQCLGFRW